MLLDTHRFISELDASPKTKTAYDQTLRLFQSFLGDREPSEELVEEFLRFLADSGKATSTQNRHLSAIRTYFNWLKKKAPKEKRAEYDLMVRGPKIHRKLPRILTREQVGKMVHAAENPFERALVMTIYDGALRIGELMQLDAEDIDWAEGYITITRKGGEETRLPLGEEALRALKTYADGRQGRLFPQAYWELHKALRSVAYRAGLKGVTPHLLRHARASSLRQHGIPLEDIRDFLGHRQFQTTLLYASIMPSELKKRIPPAF